MIVLFTDFGFEGPYLGQMKGALLREAPGVPVLDLMADAPAFAPRASAYLLAALAGGFAQGSILLCVVDPGVGTAERRPVMIKADGRWFVGPDNGLFHVLAKRALRRERWEILWTPEHLSPSFHGRDLFAPVAAALARGEMPESRSLPWRGQEFDDWPDDLPEVIYVDHYGNCMTGLRTGCVPANGEIDFNGQRVAFARTFGEVRPGVGFWYENSSGLVEIAVNQGSAASRYGLVVGGAVGVSSP